MQRIIIGSALILLSLISILLSVFFSESLGKWADVFGGLGTEGTGIALTVIIVDWLLERKRMREEVVRLAWRLMHEIDNCVYMWQGGRREFHLDEMAALLQMVESRDKVAPTTEIVLVQLGVKASDAVRLQSKLLRFDKRLAGSLRPLTGLAQLKELGSIASAEYVRDSLTQALHGLATISGQGIEMTQSNVARQLRDASGAAQKKRYVAVFGAVGAAATGDGETILGSPASESDPSAV